MSRSNKNVTRKVALLLVLYTVQAVPMGLSAAVPLLLQARGVPYSDLALYSLTTLPFSLKLLWAPIVDGSRIPRIGRRKSWLVPVQLIAGVAMLIAGSLKILGSWVGENGAEPQVMAITGFFLALYFLMATQDIAVDGWALEMLPPSKKKHASTCNTIGQSLGFYFSNVSLLILQDAETCNKFFRRTPRPSGIVSMDQFVTVWGGILIAVTAYVVVFERERHLRPGDMAMTVLEEKRTFQSDEEPNTLASEGAAPERELQAEMVGYPRVVSPIPSFLARSGTTSGGEIAARTATTELVFTTPEDDKERFAPDLSMKESYLLLWKLMQSRPIQVLAFLLLTSRIGFAATDSALMLKMIEAGVKKETVAILSPLVIPWGILSSFLAGRLIGRYTALQVFSVGFRCRIVWCFTWIGLFYLTRDWHTVHASTVGFIPNALYWVILYLSVCIQQAVAELMFVSQMAFFAQVSDESIGGTVMTLFNTLANLGNKWPGVTALFFMDKMRWLPLDPFTSLTCISVSLGLTWYFAVGRRCIENLESIPIAAWQVAPKQHADDDANFLATSTPGGTPFSENIESPAEKFIATKRKTPSELQLPSQGAQRVIGRIEGGDGTRTNGNLAGKVISGPAVGLLPEEESNCRIPSADAIGQVCG